MADQQERGAGLAADFADELKRVAGVAAVEVARRLVGEDELRVVGQRPGHGHALLLAGRELPREMSELVAQPHALEQRFRMAAVHPATERHPEFHVLEDIVALEQVEGLENIPDGRGAQPVAPRLAELGHVVAVELDATAVRREDAGDEVEEGRLARAALAAQGQLGTGLKHKRPHVHHPLRAATRRPGVGFHEVVDFQQRHG